MKEKELILPDDWEVKEVVGNKVIIREKEKVLPKTWKDCTDSFGGYGTFSVLSPVKNAGAVKALGKLLICRNAWWRQLGWKPDWKGTTDKYCITCTKGKESCQILTTANAILAFPTREVRDQFLDSFRDLIEEAKELL